MSNAYEVLPAVSRTVARPLVPANEAGEATSADARSTPIMPNPPFAGPLPLTIAAARSFLEAALREEGAALAAAGAVANPDTAGIAQRLQAVRSVEAAHARSTAAMARLRALTESAERVDAAMRGAHTFK